MEIKLTANRLDLLKEGNSFSLIQPIDKDKLVAHVSCGKQLVTYTLTELELRAIYEMLKERYGKV